MLIEVLIENTAARQEPELRPQHGISLYLETGALKILFDTGQDRTFLENAQKIGVSLQEVEWLVISHGHYDHGGGLEHFLQHNSRGSVLISRDAFRPAYARREGGEMKYIGLDPGVYARHKERFRLISARGHVFAPQLFLLANSRFEGFQPPGNGILFQQRGTHYIPDDFSHELMLVVGEADGDVIFTGCSHSGITNMLASYRDYFPGRPLKALLGGFHLADPFSGKMAGSSEAIRALAEDIAAFSIPRIYTGHCTGAEAFRLLSGRLGVSLQSFQAGKSFLL